MKKPIFLISTGRTGTKFFSRFFANYCDQVNSNHTSRFTRFLNVLGNIYYYDLISDKIMFFIWKSMKYREINDYDVRYVENNPYYYNCIDIINQLFPEVKIIWVIRHPKTFISSHIRWERQRLKSRIANYLIPFWQPITYIDQLRGIHNNYYQRVDVYSKIWAIKNKEILKSLQNKNNYICLKYENIFNPVTGIDILENLLEWLELSASKIISTDLFSNRVNSSNPIKNIWNEQCNNLMKMHCNELMQQFGYQ